MNANSEELELKDRLNLIETMIAEGRRTTESWGWTFVLWGLAYYVAIAWSVLGHGTLAWPVTMAAAFLLTVIIIRLKRGSQPRTRIGRAIGSIWIAMGISTFVLFPSLSFSGRLNDLHVFVAIVAVMLGTANATSGLILRWKAQFACALVWWATTAAACFGSEMQALDVFLVAIFLCQIVFGIYGMISESRKRRLSTSHA